MSKQRSIALCIITRNEDRVLERALISVKGGFDQLIIVDTGSSDGTQELANKWNACYCSYLQANGPDGSLMDFSAAREHALSLATTDHWFWMDSDEVAAPGSMTALRHAVNAYPRSVLNGTTVSGSRWWRPRCAPNDGLSTWKGKCHEWLEGPHEQIKIRDLVFHHLPNRSRGDRSLRRNLTILISDLQHGNRSPRNWFYLARTAQSMGFLTESRTCWNHFLASPSRGVEHDLFARLYLARVEVELNALEHAATLATLTIARRPSFAEGWCLLGDLAVKSGDTALARSFFLRALECGPCPTTNLFHEPSRYLQYPRQRLADLNPQAKIHHQ